MKKTLFKCKRLVCAFFLAALPISNIYAAEAIYDFSGGSSDTDRVGYLHDSELWTNLNTATTPDIAGEIAFSTGAYTKLTSSDGVHYVSTAAASSDIIHHFKFVISEPTNTITQIYVEWTGKGKSDGGANQNCRLKLYQFPSTGALEVAANTDPTSQITLSSAITSDYLKFIDTTTKRMDIYVTGGYDPGEIWTDYIKVVITFDDIVFPAIGLTKPVDGAYVNILPDIKGTSSDNVKVSTVTVKIQRLSDNWYWAPGPQWATAEEWNGVNNLYTSSWTLTTIPSWVDGSSYTIVAKAQDTASNWSTVFSTATFTYDISNPTSTVTLPAEGGEYLDVNTIKGTATDSVSGIDKVEAKLKRNSDGNYWDGSAWTATEMWHVAADTTSWSYDVSTITWSTGTYVTWSKALDKAGNWETVSSSVTFKIVPSTPAGPTGFAGAAQSTSSILWSWTDVASEDGYKVRNATGSLMQTLGANVTSWLETAGLSINTSYYRYVEAYNSGGSSACATIIRYTLANNHSGLSFTGVTGSSVTFQWTHGNPSYTNWGIYRSTDNFVTSTATLKNFAANYTSSSYTDTGLTDLTTYWYKVQAFNGDGIGSDFNNIISTKTLDETPPTVGITKPTSTYVNSLGQIEGTAADNGGIDFVNVELKRNTDNYYFDSATWQTGQTWLGTNVYPSSWTYSDVDLTWINGSSYTITARSCDTALIYSATTTVTFTYDIDLPTSTVTFPLEEGEYESIDNITGTSSDKVSGVWATKIKIFALTGPYIGAWWQDGTGWQGAEFWNDASGTDSWSFDTSMITWSTGTYNVQPKTQDVAGNWEVAESSVTFTIVPSTPSSPAGFSGIAQSVGAINWSWTDGTGEDGYKIITDTGGLIAVRAAGTTFYIETGLSVNTSYQRYVEAYNTAGSSASAVSSVYTLAYPPLTTAIVASSTGSVTITWQDNSNPSWTRWGIERSTYSNFFETWVISTFISDYTTIGYTDTGITADTTYYYRVRAYNGDAVATAFDSTVSTVTAIAADVTAPSALSDLVAIPGANNGEIALSWTAPGDDGVTGTLEGIYRIDYATYTKSWSSSVYEIELPATGSAPGTSLNRTVSALTGGVTYYFRLWSADEALNWSSVSNSASSFAKVIVSTPAAPTVFSGAAQSASSIMWTWTDNSSNEDGFYLKDSSDVIVNTLAAAATFYLETGLGVNEEIYRYLAAYNAYGENSSIPAAIYTLANAPSAFSVTVTSYAVTLDWSANGNPAVTDYDIEWSTAPDFSVTDYDTTTDVSYLVAPLVSDTTYYIRVCALNGDAYSTAFYETSAFTAEPDLTAPAPVTAFTAETVNIKGAVKLSWTNPGNDGTLGTIIGGAQMIRYVTGAVTTLLPDIVKNIIPGTTEALTISGLVPGGAYTLYIKVKDDAGNVSAEVSAVVSAGAQPVLNVHGITSPITAGVSSDFTVEAKNALGAIDTSYAGAVTFESKIMDGSYAGANAMVALPVDYNFTSADNGAHVFSGAVFLEKGELYSCYVRAVDIGDALITGQQVVTVSPLDFISGIVTQKDGTPLTGVYVEAYGTGLSTGVPFTTINGSYTVIGLDIGTYTVRATWTDAGGLESSAEKQASNGTAAFNFTLGINFDLSIVQGMVLGLSASSIRSAAGLIMPQATSEYAFVEISAGRKVMRIPVAGDGSFCLGNLLPGRYSARAWDGSRYSNSETLVLSGGASATVKFTFPVSAKVYCWPNPFIELKTNEAGVHISYIGPIYVADLKIYTITGELVRESRDFIAFTRVEDSLTGYEFVWDLRNNSRQDVASGVYFYILELTDAAGGARKYKGKIGVVR